MKTVRVDKPEFVQFLELATRAASLAFSTNGKGRVWPTGAFSGLTSEEEGERVYLEGRSELLDRAAGTYAGAIRPMGGKFKVDFHGAFCYGRECYFIEWIKSQDLVDYELSIPENPTTRLDLIAQMAKQRGLNRTR